MHYAVCRECRIEQSPRWQPGEACFVCAGTCDGCLYCPSCFKPQTTVDLVDRDPGVAVPEASSRCLHCGVGLPSANGWLLARVVARAYAGNASQWSEVAKSLSNEELGNLSREGAEQIDVALRVFDGLDALNPWFLAPFFRHHFTPEALSYVPARSESIGSWLAASRLPELSSPDALKLVLRTGVNAGIRWLAAAALVRLGEKDDSVAYMFPEAWGWNLHFVVAAAALKSNWRFRDAFARGGYGRRAMHPDSRAALLLSRCLEHRYYKDWALLAVCEWLVNVPKSPAEAQFPEVSALRERTATLLERLSARLGEATAGAPLAALDARDGADWRLSAALLLTDENALVGLFSHPDRELAKAAEAAYVRLPIKMSSLRGDRIKKTWADGSAERQLEMMRSLRSASGEGTVPFLLSLVETGKGEARRELVEAATALEWGRLTPGDLAVTAALVAKRDGGFTPDLPQSLRVLDWLWRTDQPNLPEAVQAASAALAKHASTLFPSATSEAQAAAISYESYGAFPWLAESVFAGSFSFTSLFRTAPKDRLGRLLDLLGEIEDGSRLKIAPRPGVTLPALDALLAVDDLARQRLLCEFTSVSWIRRLMEGPARESALEVMAKAAAPARPARLFALAWCSEQLDATEARLEAEGHPLLAEPQKDIPTLLVFGRFTPYDLLKRTLAKTPSAKLSALATAMLVMAQERAGEGPGHVVPVVKLLFENAHARIEKAGDDPEAWSVFGLVAEGWPKVKQRLIASGTAKADDYYVANVENELADFRERAEKVRQKARERAESAAPRPAPATPATAAAPAVDPAELAAEEARLKERQASIESTQKAVDLGTQRLILTTKYQAEISALMAKADLDPMERALKVQALVAEMQKALLALG